MEETFAGPAGTWVGSGAFWSGPALGAAQNRRWFAESGALARGGGVGTTAAGTFRMWTRRATFGDVRVDLRLRLDGFTRARRPIAGWDGVKLWLRRRLQTPGPGGRVDDGATAGYTAEVALRDGRVYVQKKVGDRYDLLSATPRRPFPLGSWHEVGGLVRTNADGSVTIEVLRDGRVAAAVTDRGGAGGPPLRAAGRVGLRSDDAAYEVDDLRIRPSAPGI